MSESPKSDNKALFTVLKWAFVADVIWAVLLATLQAIVLAETGGVLGTSVGGTTAAAILAWIITFVIAFTQGAVFLIVIGGFIFVGALILSGGFKKGDRSGTNTDTDTDQKQ